MSERRPSTTLRNVDTEEQIGNAVCVWWSGLSREARVWVYNTALNAAVDLAMETPLPPLGKDAPAEQGSS